MNDKNNNFHENELDIKELFVVCWKKRLTITLITSFFAVFSVVYALMLPNIYSSSALLVPSESEDSLSSQLGQFSSIASLGGISLPPQRSSRASEAIERIKSFEFFSTYFLPNIKLEDMMAVKKWDPSNNELIYDDNRFSLKTKKWVKKKPSEQQAFITYKNALVVNQDKMTSFVKISFSHQSPEVAKEWVEIIIYNINESMRLEDISASQNYINFLNEAQQSTNVQSLREVVSRLLENQMQTLMLASSNESYIFKTIDSPIRPELKSSPNRSIICIAITLFGGIFSMLLVLFRHYFVAGKKEDIF
jgi:LPS O-antigen subunit length determinant protein (WzzB/FepE family)